ncbi:MAG: hypothetical protein BA863_16380 [Desulfovibrio sp. S3730MH75]|nr:MAG: hypothetical protein BA863_16380 [Desulfovibrio sp. S3730MH75]
MAYLEAESLVFNALHKTPVFSERICAGKNSRVYRVDCDSKESYAVKFYMQPTADGRNRLDQEWAAVSFMVQTGIRRVPKPIAIVCSSQAAVYSFLRGTPVGERNGEEIGDVLDFVRQLKLNSLGDRAVNILPATEACFSLNDIISSLEGRLDRLSELPRSDDLFVEMHEFLQIEYAEAFSDSVQSVKVNYPVSSWSTSLPIELRTLSPSDLGFHNSVRDEYGHLLFLDFEYFGWDDPVKMAADFLLHPAMNLQNSEVLSFYDGMLQIFSDDECFETRFKTFLPFYRLKWCLILLNEFFSEGLKRRRFASGSGAADNDLRQVQLEKAKMFLNKDKDICKIIF